MSRANGRLRVLLLIDHAGIRGGAERFVTGLATNLPRDRIEPWVCSTRVGWPEAVAVLTDAGVKHVDLGRRHTHDIPRLAELFRLLRRERFDVLHSHMFGSNVWAAMFGPASRVPVVLAHEHNWSYSGDRLRLWLDGWLIGRATTRFIAVSESNRKRMIELEGVPARKIEVMPTAYIPSARTSGDIRHELGLGADVPMIGTAAILRPEKSLETLIDAHALLRERFPGIGLVIAGDGPCHQQLEDYAQRAGGKDVYFLGARTDVDSILRSIDVAAMSSVWEGMPLFLFECMAAETPVVATGVGGILEVVEDGRNGLLVPPRDPRRLADALAAILRQPEEGRRLAAAAAARLPQYRIDAVAERFADLYERLYHEVASR